MSGQSAFTAALTDPLRPVPSGLVSPRGTPDAKRFAVYRNNIHVSLVGALAARFPVSQMLVGEEFFTAMARLYVVEHKPRSPVLLHYGDSFPGFIAAFPPARIIPFLSDLARLELAWTQSYNAADTAPLKPADLARLAPEALAELRLFWAPATRLVRSHWSVGSIWSAHQTVPFVPPRTEAPETVLITRPLADVRLTIIPPAAAVLLDALHAGKRLAQAAEITLDHFPEFDPGSALVGLADLGAFAAPAEEVSHAS